MVYGLLTMVYARYIMIYINMVYNWGIYAHININHGLLTMLYYTIPMVFIKQQTSPWQRSLRLRRSAAVAQGLFQSQAAGFEAWDHHDVGIGF